VRETFANLLSTTFQIAVRNEESYLGQVIKVFDFAFEGNSLQKFQVASQLHQQAATLRFIDQVLSSLSSIRAHWDTSDEFFVLLQEFARSHFQIVFYLVSKGLIGELVQIVQGEDLLQRLEGSLRPNHEHVYDLLGYLVTSCLTQGIKEVCQYSPCSVFQTDEKIIMLPRDQVIGFLSQRTLQGVLESANSSSSKQNRAVKNILIHLCWGDLDISQFVLCEVLGLLKQRKNSFDIFPFLF